MLPREMTKLVTKAEFLRHYPYVKDRVKSFLTERLMPYCQSPANEWLEKLFDYNVPCGKLNRGLTCVHAYQFLRPDVSHEDLKSVCSIGWTLELLETCFLIADDIMDNSKTRRGKPCWYKVDNIGTGAINDAFLLENAADWLLSEELKDKSSLFDIRRLFNQAKLFTVLGQNMDGLKFNLDSITEQRYLDITRFKTSYYTFVLPIFIALRMTTNTDLFDKELENLCFSLGYYFQSQDDFLDCFGDPVVTGKIGTDIEEGKCTWLVVQALKILRKTNDIDGLELLKDNYNSFEEDKVQSVKELYESLGLRSLYAEYEVEKVSELRQMIKSLTLSELKPLFNNLLSLLLGRSK